MPGCGPGGRGFESHWTPQKTGNWVSRKGKMGGPEADRFKELRTRTIQFATDVVNLVDAFPSPRTTDVLGKQLLHSATSIGANYRAACRARSHAEFVSKMHTVQEEADETQYWFELLHNAGIVSDPQYNALQSEARELTAIFTASERTARTHLKQIRL